MMSKINNILRQIGLQDSVTAKDSLTIIKLNKNKQQTGMSVVDDEHEFSSQREHGVHSETARIKANVSPKILQEMQEVQAAERFLPQYNKSHGTDYDRCESFRQNDSVDVLCISKSGQHENLKVQVTVSDGEAVGQLSAEKHFERAGTGGELFFKSWKQVIDKKSKRYSISDKSNIILVLDGWPVVYEQDLEEFKTAHSAYLKLTGFKEIWFVGLSRQYIIRLY